MEKTAVDHKAKCPVCDAEMEHRGNCSKLPIWHKDFYYCPSCDEVYTLTTTFVEESCVVGGQYWEDESGDEVEHIR